MPKKHKKLPNKKYQPPVLEQYNIRELSKNWDLEVVGEVISCGGPD